MSHFNSMAWAVFNPTDNDWLNVNETAQNAPKDLGGTRYLLTLKHGSESYVFEGVGDYGGPISNIEAQDLTPEQQIQIATSPRWTAQSSGPYLNNFENCMFSRGDLLFKCQIVAMIQALLLQENEPTGAPANVAAAYTLLGSTMTALHNLDLDNAYLKVTAATPAGLFTQAIKDDVSGALSDYLKKYPR